MNRNELIRAMEAILDGARAAGRDLTSAEAKRFDDLERQHREAGIPETRGAVSGDDAHREAFDNYLRYGEISRELRLNPMSTSPGAPAAGTATAGYGGYLVPQGFWHNLQVALKQYGGLSQDMRQVDTPTGNPMPWPTVDPTGIVGSLISENTQLTEVDFTIGQGMLSAWTVTSGVHLVSRQVVEDSAFEIDEFIAARAGESIGRKLASLAWSGTGSSQPLGVQTAIVAKGAHSGSSGGYVALGTATDVAIFGNYSSPTTTEITGNVLSGQSVINLVSAIDPAYLPTSSWYLNPQLAWNMRGVTDGQGRPLLNFANGFDADNVNGTYGQGSSSPVGTLLGFPVRLVPEIPVLTASTLSGALFGSLQHAFVQRTVAAPTGVTVMRLEERYADYLQVGYVSYMRVDMRSNDLRAVTGAMASTS
jgi:HK97 family phage major capsid protein